jgi:hypothetical protein
MDFNDVTKNGVAFKTILEGLSITKATNKLLLMDTCHAGNTLDIEETEEDKTTLSEEGQRVTITKLNSKDPKFKVSDIVTSLFDDFLSKSGVTILSASSGSDVAYKNKELSNGAFTSAYLKVLKSKLSEFGDI